ncbi:hypothetical protein [Cognaticolwellia aestuarii]|uniref:hypothetical protein n=1 Tax=Cognaticolwellia aestuarii TaxID=329993 RepID=UPI000987CBAF|nr:hypothetical protein [Cognaticolwellia aestuarii]
MDYLKIMFSSEIGYVFLIVILALVIVWAMYRMVVWSKRMPKGAFVFLAFLPLISIFPIPPQEIKKLERIKQEQIKNEDESSEPPNED